ncbi:MAG: hypothetical protein VYC99_07010, partial [Pseudomonadota bacterium]|nr:hypothetical protein [Pseudomonadota bacterium]
LSCFASSAETFHAVCMIMRVIRPGSFAATLAGVKARDPCRLCCHLQYQSNARADIRGWGGEEFGAVAQIPNAPIIRL